MFVQNRVLPQYYQVQSTQFHLMIYASWSMSHQAAVSPHWLSILPVADLMRNQWTRTHFGWTSSHGINWCYTPHTPNMVVLNGQQPLDWSRILDDWVLMMSPWCVALSGCCSTPQILSTSCHLTIWWSTWAHNTVRIWLSSMYQQGWRCEASWVTMISRVGHS